MSIEKKSLISNMTATKKALIASNTTGNPLVSNKTASKKAIHASKTSVQIVRAGKAGARFTRG